jgi:hypothetical protein
VFVEQIKNPGKTFPYNAASGRIAYPIAWTDAIAASPITTGVKNLWYPVDRDSFWYNTTPLELTAEWTPLVKTGPGAKTVVTGEDYVHGVNEETPRFSPEKGREGDFPIVGTRQLGNGRVTQRDFGAGDGFEQVHRVAAERAQPGFVRQIVKPDGVSDLRFRCRPVQRPTFRHLHPRWSKGIRR